MNTLVMRLTGNFYNMMDNHKRMATSIRTAQKKKQHPCCMFFESLEVGLRHFTRIHYKLSTMDFGISYLYIYIYTYPWSLRFWAKPF